MKFFFLIALVILCGYLTQPLGPFFIHWVNLQSPHLLSDFSPHSRYLAQLLLLQFPSIFIVMIWWLKAELYQKKPAGRSHTNALIFVGVCLYLTLVIGRNGDSSFSNYLNHYLQIGLGISRFLLTVGCVQLLSQKNPDEAAATGGGPGGGDEEALAALMGMMGGAPGGPGGPAGPRPAPGGGGGRRPLGRIG